MSETTAVTETGFSAESWRNRTCCKGDVMEQDGRGELEIKRKQEGEKKNWKEL